MLYIFDLGNVIVDIDFNRVLGAWSDLTRIPLASLKKSFHMGEAFHQHERGEISDEAFAEALCHEMALPLSYEQFSHGWQAVFVALRPEVIAIMHKLREQGHRVVVLDERFELSADGFDLGACTDILQGYPKQEGLSHAVRCLSPEYIVCDELGENDLSAIRSASFSGVALIASIHAGSVHELCCRPLCRGILSLGAFETVALLHGRSAPTKVEKLFLAGDLLENNGGDPDCSVRGDRRVIGICAAKNA